MASYYLRFSARGEVVEQNDSISGSGALEHAGEHHSHTGTILFLFLAFAIGAAVRHLLKRTPLPYTVILIVLGLALGAAPKWQVLSFLQEYIVVAQMDPHLMLIIFLPTLIFESAFVMDVHTFKKTIGQALILAGPGLLLSAFLTSLMARFIFSYQWSWVVALLFGVIMSATDPVAVVALLKELGASKQLGVIIEGESLLNDGVAIVIFNVLKDELIPGHGRDALQIFLYFVQVALGGPALGYIMAKITIFWLSRVFNDALVEIAITLASTYVTFYIGEELLGVSGVLAVVTLGIEINSRKTNISPEVEVFLHRFWEVLGYLANTLIFLLVGVVIAQRAFQDVETLDWMLMIALYLGIMVIRLLVTGFFQPILTRIGYSMNWKHTIVISWGGLRGAVGLALALVVAQTSAIDFDNIGSKVLFHTAGIVIFTLVINATTTKYLLRGLGMSDVSSACRKTMSTAVARVNDAKTRAIGMLKSDRFLADASWDVVEKLTKIEDPYKHLDYDELTEDNALFKTVTSQCPQCEAEVPRVPNRKELVELAEEVRMRVIKAEKTSYWRQFEQGMLGREAVRVLTNLADSVMDSPDRLITLKDLAPYWRVPCFFNLMRRFIRWAGGLKSNNSSPAPTNKYLLVHYKVASHTIFEWSIFGIIIINGIITVIELSITDELTHQVLTYVNYVFCAVYLIEAVIKMIGLRKYYWLSKWNLFDFVILIVSFVEIILDVSFPAGNSSFSPAVFRIVKILRIFRVGRVLRLMKLLIPKMIKLVDYFVNRRLRFGYDIGRGFVVGEEELLHRYDRIKLVHNKVAEELKKRLDQTRIDVIRSLGLIRKEHPGVALSVKTDQATRSVLNHCQDVIKQMLSNGLLDEVEAHKLLQILEMRIKHLESTQTSLPPPNPDHIFRNLAWLNGLEPDVVSELHQIAEIAHYDTGEVLMKMGEVPDGIFIITSGLVKVFTPTIPNNSSDSALPKVEAPSTITNSSLGDDVAVPIDLNDFVMVDFFGAGTVLGEMAILHKIGRIATVECETDVQAFFIRADLLTDVIARNPVLEERLWRVCGIRLARATLSNQPQYLEWPTSKLSLMCEASYIVKALGGPVPTFEIAADVQEVVVLSGEVRSLATREHFKAPCVIPKTVKRLMMNIGDPVLLVITTAEAASQKAPPVTENKDGAAFVKMTLKARLISKLMFSYVTVKIFCLKCLKRAKVEPEPQSCDHTIPLDDTEIIPAPASDNAVPQPTSDDHVTVSALETTATQLDQTLVANCQDQDRVFTPIAPLHTPDEEYNK